MVQGKIKSKGPQLPHLPMSDVAQPGAKYLIAAMFAAGKNNCDCECCQLMVQARAEFSSLMLQEVKGSGDQNSDGE